ncbi:MAG: succinylglutamate desuccinylase/aspartoacylase family protein [Tatlockia sp.]|nr:succinylglutamate desuccinylase/aspartoacylase family protein [Tatlockia sp.]
MLKDNTTLSILGKTVSPGCKNRCLYKISNLFTRATLEIPIHVNHGKNEGPKVFILSAIHGDEINGIEIINQLHQHPAYENISGTLITIPVANPYGLIQQKREVVKNDLNRSFPGEEKGNPASRLAYFYYEEIIKHCDYGLDIHSGGQNLFNCPQLRVTYNDKNLEEFALAFGVPVLESPEISKSLRTLTKKLKIPFITYEAGEAGRHDPKSIKPGLQGILNTLCYLKMIDSQWKTESKAQLFKKMKWIRAPISGVFISKEPTDTEIEEDQVLGEILDPFNLGPIVQVKSEQKGLIIGRSTSPLVNEGDPLFHIAYR